MLFSPPPLAVVTQIWITSFPSFPRRLILLRWYVHYPLHQHWPLVVRQIISSRKSVPALSKKMLLYMLLGIFQGWRKLHNWGGGTHIHIFLFCNIDFFRNRLFPRYVNTNILICAPPPPPPPIIEHPPPLCSQEMFQPSTRLSNM